MSSSPKLLSHPNKPLIEHLEGVAKKSQEIVQGKTLDRDYSRITFLIGAAHDFGKATSFFQQRLADGTRSEKSRHSAISALFAYYLLKTQGDGIVPPIIGWFVVQRHHGQLTDLDMQGELRRKIDDENQQTLVKSQAHDLKREWAEIERMYSEIGVEVNLEGFLDSVIDGSIFKDIKIDYMRNLEMNLKEGESLDMYFQCLFLYSVLLDADKLDAAGVDLPSRQVLPHQPVERFKKDNFHPINSDLNRIREDSSKTAVKNFLNNSLDNRIHSLTLPTGAGKTLTALQCALNLRQRVCEEAGFTPRIIYSLPFLSIIEQNHDVFQRVLEHSLDHVPTDLILKHHYLSEGFARESETDQDASKALLLTEGWHSEIVITTFVQFFESMITNRNARARKFHNMANSIIILDEVQAIPRKYWKLVNHALKLLCHEFNCWIILMTATNPLIFRENEITELVSDKTRIFEYFDRIDHSFNLEEQNLGDLGDMVLDDLRESDRDVMVVLNTINASKELYGQLSAVIREEGLDVEPIYLSTNILPKERLERISRIKNSDRQKLVVTTQLVEAGVDIDLDIVYRDFAPLDSIIQTAGRCNREFADQKGFVRVLRLVDERTGRTYASYIYDKILLDATESVLAGFPEHVSEKEFNLRASNAYFELVREWGADEKANEILNKVSGLHLSDIGFNLIENDIQSVSVFIERDDEAKRVRKEVESIFEEDYGYERRGKLLKFKRDFNNYIIDARVKDGENQLATLECFAGLEDIRVIPKEDCSEWYHPETGFEYPDSFELFFI